MSGKVSNFALDFNTLNMMNTFVDTLEDTDVMEVQDDLSPEDRVYWQRVIDEAHYDPDRPKTYMSVEEFRTELMAAVERQYARI